MAEQIDSIGSVGSATSADLPSSHDSPGLPSAAPSRAPATDASSRPSAAPRTDAVAGSAPPSLQAAVEQLNARLAGADRVLELRVDAATGITVAELKNASTGQVLRQMPSDDVLRLAQMLSGWSGSKSLLDLIA